MDDFELHHGYLVKEQGKGALRDYYIQEMNNRLFTDEELIESVRTYDEYKRKDYFLRNYRIMRYDRLSIFSIGEEARRKFEEAKPDFPYCCDISFCYVADRKIAETQKKYSEHLEAGLAALKKSDDTFREMIGYELANHEACITGDCRDALVALGYTWDELTESQKRITREELNRQYDSYMAEDAGDIA